MLDSESENFKEELAFNLWSTQSSSDYRNDRERPYNGQPWTDNGERGKTEVKGLTMRDISDCIIKGMLLAANSPDVYFERFTEYWDFSSGEAKPTQLLLDNLDNFLQAKAELGKWRPQDLYKIDWEHTDPLAGIKNAMVEIEKMMGIYPNLPK